MSNKYQEAYNIVFDGLPMPQNLSKNEKELLYKSVDIFKELVDKETPMKPIRPFIDDCPKCGEFITDTSEHFKENIPLPNYCPKCGQKLDWSDEH